MRARHGAWLAVGAVLALTVAGFFAAVIRQSWLSHSAATQVVDLEKQGAAILHPVTTLVSELVEARSAAVRGAQVDAESVRNALAGVAELDAQYGEALQTTQRLHDLTTRVEEALDAKPTGRPAYEAYSVIVTLAIDLELLIGDTSHLVHDPDLDSFYLVDAAVVRLPQAMVYAGSASDLVALAGVADLQGQDAIKAAVARFGVSAAAEALTDGLNKSVQFTASDSLSGNIAERLDAFKAAAADFAPPTALVPVAGAVSAETLAANANRVFAAANPLAHRLLAELQALLQARADRLADDWRFTTSAAAVAGVAEVALVALLVALAIRSRASEAADEPPEVGSLAYARELLRAPTPQPVGSARGRGDAH